MLVAPLALLAIAGCSDPSPQGGTDVGNGATAALEVRAYQGTAEQQKAGAMVLVDGTRVDEAWMVVERIRLRPGAVCSGGDDEVDVEDPLIAELLEGGVLGGPASFPIEPGPFCRLRVRFHDIDAAAMPAGSPADLGGLSILVKGAREDGTAFVVRSRVNDELELEAKDGSFQLGAGRNPLFLAYELGTWTAALDLGSLPGGADIEIGNDANAERLQAFEDAVKASARLFRDANDDGELSVDEHEADSALAE